jgi:hypothetical protein
LTVHNRTRLTADGTHNPLGETTKRGIGVGGSDFEPSQQALLVTINERSSILSSFSLYELYRLTKKNMQGRLQYSYDEWKRGDQQLCIVRPSDLLQLANVYKPQTVSFAVKYGLNEKHDEREVQECKMSFFYVDFLTLASGAASLSSFLVNESQLKRGGIEEDDQKLDDLALQ